MGDLKGVGFYILGFEEWAQRTTLDSEVHGIKVRNFKKIIQITSYQTKINK